LTPLSKTIANLPTSETWLRGSIYALFILSTFSRTGVDLATVALLLVGIYRAVRYPVENRLPYWTWLPFAVLLGGAVLTTVVKPNFVGNLTHLNHLFRFFLPFAMVPALFRVDVRRLLLIYLFFICLMAAYGVLQHYSGVNFLRIGGRTLPTLDNMPNGPNVVYRAKGVFRNPLTYTTMMVMAAPLFLGLFLEAKEEGGKRFLWLFGGVMGAIGIAASVARGAMIGLFLALLVLALRLRPRYSVPIIAVGLALFATVASLAATGWIQAHFAKPNQSPYISRFVNTTIATSRERLYRWEAGWLAIQDNPWLGVGPDKRLKKLVVPYMLEVSKRHGNYGYQLLPSGLVHNVHLQMAIHFGVVGFAAEWGMWIMLFYWSGLWIRRAGEGFPLEKGMLWGASASIAAAIVDGMFNANLLDGADQAIILMFFGIALYAGLRVRRGLGDQGAEGPSPAKDGNRV
jgi:O-antigen ligase